MMKVYIDEPEASPELKEQIKALLATHRAAADLVDKIADAARRSSPSTVARRRAPRPDRDAQGGARPAAS